MKFTRQPLKRTAIELILDEDGRQIGPVATDRSGRACFDIPASSGKIMVAGVERFQGRLDGDIAIELFSLSETGPDSEGAAANSTRGSNAYPNMTTRSLLIKEREVLTDSEGYLVDPDDWSEQFVRTLAQHENLKLTSEHWEVIRFQRHWYASHGRQATVRHLIKGFRDVWGKDRGSSQYLHHLFPRGGPQKQGNRLAGLLRPKGEV
jgi:tRNA 2-thiouridine synthesizing protein E